MFQTVQTPHLVPPLPEILPDLGPRPTGLFRQHLELPLPRVGITRIRLAEDDQLFVVAERLGWAIPQTARGQGMWPAVLRRLQMLMRVVLMRVVQLRLLFQARIEVCRMVCVGRVVLGWLMLLLLMVVVV